jgi:hypothetical protein
MTDFEVLDNCKYLVVNDLFEPSQNELAMHVEIGAVSNTSEMVQVSRIPIGPVRKVNFDTQDTYSIYFDSYISYFVVNESFDRGMIGEFSGNRIRRYSNSNFIDFCKQQNIYIKLWDSPIIHFAIVTSNHIIHVLTTSEPEISKLV